MASVMKRGKGFQQNAHLIRLLSRVEQRLSDTVAAMGQLNSTGGSAVAVEAGPGGTPMKRVAVACLVGSTIEFYDFTIYGTAAALVFPTVFFSQLSPAMATIASMGTFATAFLSRPPGAAVFGHFGDRLGRKKTLVATLLIMAVSTVAVGLVPARQPSAGRPH
jgi:hypothetical protein